MSSSAGKTHKNKLILRGIKQSSPLGTGLFLGLRTLDPLLQYGILAKGIASRAIHKLGGKTLPQGPPVMTGTFLDGLALSPYRLILLGMAAGSALKQNYWLVAICQEQFPPLSAIEVSVFNAVFNSVNSLLFTCSLTSASTNGEHFPQTPLLVGATLYAVGIFTETFSEWQRLQFKKKSANKGKVYTGGLFSLARHINYAGYTMWRAGYALAAGGWTWGAIVGAFFSYNFISDGIPELNRYCQERVGSSCLVLRISANDAFSFLLVR
jgi:protein-S-isoprenylcysteine O-methyltransferase Ste14